MSGSDSRRPVRRRTFVLGAAAAGSAALAGPLAVPSAAAAAFGYTDDGSNYVVDTGAALVFKVSKTTGDLTSLIYRGTEYQGYGGKNSHIESGLGSSTVTIAQSGSTILISVTHGTLRHYYAARSGENNVYLWTNKADTSVSATRYIVRVKAGRFLNDEPDSYTYTTSTSRPPTSSRSRTVRPAPSTTPSCGSSTTTTSAGRPAVSGCGSCAATTRRPPAGLSTAPSCATRAPTAEACTRSFTTARTRPRSNASASRART